MATGFGLSDRRIAAQLGFEIDSGLLWIFGAWSANGEAVQTARDQIPNALL
jgi:hypothetical protein